MQEQVVSQTRHAISLLKKDELVACGDAVPSRSLSLIEQCQKVMTVIRSHLRMQNHVLVNAG
jgi:hypothetical protein